MRRAGEVDRSGEHRQAAAVLEDLIASSPVVMFRGGPAFGSLEYASSNIEGVLGYTVEEALSTPQFWFERMHPDHRDAIVAERRRLFAAGAGGFEYEVPFRRKSGEYVWLYVVARFVRDETGAPAGVFGYAMDIQQRKAAEEAGCQAREEANRASRAKSEFLSRMSHELRTPLNAILGFAQLLEMDALSAEQRDSVKQILRGGRHLLDLINEVLDITRIEAGQSPVSLEPVGLAEVIAEALDLIMPLAAGRGITITNETPEEWARFVLADSQRLKQVLLNLLSNAAKYNHPRGRVSVSCRERPGGWIRIGVADTGPGIAPGKIERLFVPFERLDAERIGVEGTGIGLAHSKALTESMGGVIGVGSEVGRGSTFWIDLPAAEGPEAAESVISAPPSETLRRARAQLVLYIDNNPSNHALMERMLGHRPDIRLLAAMQGRLGLDLARQHHPATILLDLHLEDLSGDEVLRRLRADPRTVRTPVVILSADADQGQVDRLLALGATAYLTKPVDVKRLLGILGETLAERSGVRP